MPEPLLIAKSTTDLYLLPQFTNRHGLIAGATGTGKTVTLQRVAEGLSRIGVPVFMADVKGDLSGMAAAGTPKPKLEKPWSSSSPWAVAKADESVSLRALLGLAHSSGLCVAPGNLAPVSAAIATDAPALSISVERMRNVPAVAPNLPQKR